MKAQILKHPFYSKMRSMRPPSSGPGPAQPACHLPCHRPVSRLGAKFPGPGGRAWAADTYRVGTRCRFATRKPCKDKPLSSLHTGKRTARWG